MNRLFSLALCLCALAALCAAPAARAAAGPESDIAAVEEYLGGITTLRARFVQSTGDGQEATGTFLLSRPGRMRFEYDPPLTDFIVADGLFIYYYDGEMKQQSNAPISSSLADFFLREDLKLGGDIEVSGVWRENGLLQVSLAQAADPRAGTLTLSLSENPMQLRKWSILDAQGALTEVTLSDIETGISLKRKLFQYHDPARKEERYN